jgi:hypothetical protein
MDKGILMFRWLLSSVFISSSIFAQTSTSLQNSNSIETDLGASRILDIITPDRAGHFSIFNGPSLSRNGSRSYDFQGNQIDSDGAPITLSSWHQVSFQWELGNNTQFIINPRFIIDYNNPDANQGRGAGSLDNPVFGINSVWYKNGNFTFAGSINTIFAAVTEDSQQDQLIANPGGFQAMNYKVNNSLVVGGWLWGRYNYALNADNSAPVFIAPYLTYTFNDTVSVQPFYQYNGEVADAQRVDWDADDSFNLMVNFRINKYLTMMPIVTVFRETDFNVARGNLNMWVSGSF